MDHFLRPGLPFDVIDSGPADAPAVVLLHGFPQQPCSFEAVASRLNAEGLRNADSDAAGLHRRRSTGSATRLPDRGHRC
jgi:pimeloyl-ACP methyl ester carboxylesterase